MYGSAKWSEYVYILLCKEEVQLQRNNEINRFQQQINLSKEIDELWNLMEIDELWNLMQVSKKSYSRVKQTVSCVIVENYEGKASGALQHKTWKPGRLNPTMRYDVSKAYGQLQNKVWDTGKRRIEDT